MAETTPTRLVALAGAGSPAIPTTSLLARRVVVEVERDGPIVEERMKVISTRTPADL